MNTLILQFKRVARPCLGKLGQRFAEPLILFTRKIANNESLTN